MDLRNPILFLTGSFLLSFAHGAGYDVRKVVATGDAVPGFDQPEVTETFRYFRFAHMFPDGSVAFAGITTRNQSVQRNGPRGIYYSEASGVLSTIAEIDDAEAWRSIGLPHGLMDSNNAKTFAFDFLQPTETSLQEVVAIKTFGDPVFPLTPIDETDAVVSSDLLPENQVYEGRFEVDLGGLVLNEAEQILFSTSFYFKNDPQTPVKGLFLGSKERGVRNIAFAGDPVPGIVDATFTEFNWIALGEDGTAFFCSGMTGDGAPRTANQALWMEKDGAFTLVAREGSPAPGLNDYFIRLTALNLLYLDVQGDSTIVTGGISKLAGSLIRAYWIGSTAGPELTPFLKLDNYPNLNDPEIFTVTDQGNVAFTSVDNNSIQLDSAGNIYFDGGGKFVDDTSIGGIWKRSKSDGSIAQVVPWDFENGLSQFALLDVNDQGDLLFQAQSGGVKGIWVRNMDGGLTNIVNIGDVLEGREIIHIVMLSTVDTLGDRRYLDLMNSSGNFVFVAQFEDGDGDNYRDEGVFVAQPLPDPTDMFIWSGDAGDDDWHKALNWDDKETGSDAVISPGDEAGAETIEIPNSDVVVSNRPARIKAITASGSLTVKQPLTIETASTIEDLVLNAGLVINDELLLLGEPQLKEGTVTGSGSLTYEEAANGSWVPLAQGGSDTHNIMVATNVFGTLNHGDNVVLDIKEGGYLNIKKGGTYKAKTGKIAYTANNILNSMTNSGAIEISGTNEVDTFTIEPFLFHTEGSINVLSGELILNNEADYKGGEANVGSGARLVFGNPVEDPLLNIGSTITGDFSASGLGTIVFKGNKLDIFDGNKATFDMSIVSGGLEVEDGAEINGKGALLNQGRMLFREGIVRSKLENEGTLLVTGSQEVVNLALQDAQFINRQLVSQDELISIRRSGDSAPLSAITNEGSWVLEDGAEIALLEGDAQFLNRNSGVLKMQGAGQVRIRVPVRNEGLVRVLKGRLLFDHDTTWESNVIGTSLMQIESGAALELNDAVTSSVTSHSFNSDVEVVGGGQLDLKGGKLDLAGGAKLINAGSEIRIFDNLRTGFNGELVNRQGKVSFVSDVEHPSVTWDMALINKDRQVVELPGNFSLRLNRYGSQIFNEGEFNVIGSIGVFQPLSSLISRATSGWGGAFVNIGYLTVDTASNAKKLVTRIEPSFWASYTGLNGTVELKNQTWLDIENPDTATVAADSSIFGASGLSSGEWIIGPDCLLSFRDREFNRIGRFASVTFEGKPADSNVKDGYIKGMPKVVDDFVNDGELALEGAAFMIINQKFINNGTMRFRPGKLEMIEADGGVCLFRNEGRVYGSSLFEGGLVVNNGIISPGESAGSITVNGDFTQEASGELQIELSGMIAGEDYDQLVVNGTASLAGSLRLSGLDGSFPEDGTSFVPITATSVQGQFDEVIFDVPSGRQKFDVEIEATGVVALSRVLNVSTFTAWRAGVFTAEEQATEGISGLMDDPDDDGIVNLLEYVFDGNPRISTRSPVGIVIEYVENGSLKTVQAAYPWANGMTDAQASFEYSTNLETWFPLDGQYGSPQDQGPSSLLSFSANLPDEIGSTVFVRLAVSVDS